MSYSFSCVVNLPTFVGSLAKIFLYFAVDNATTADIYGDLLWAAVRLPPWGPPASVRWQRHNPRKGAPIQLVDRQSAVVTGLAEHTGQHQETKWHQQYCVGRKP
jgi:hypothetical protein